MSGGRSYRFESAAHWQLCLRAPLPAQEILAPDSGHVAARTGTPAQALVSLGGGSFAWIDGDGAIVREGNCAGPEIGAVRRLCAAQGTIIALVDDSVWLIDAETLQRIDRLDLPGVLDIAADHRGGLWVLAPRLLRRLDAAGRECERHDSVESGYCQIAALPDCVAMFDPAAGKLALMRRGEKIGKTIDLAVSGSGGFGRFAARTIQSGSKGFLITGLWDNQPGLLAIDEGGNPQCQARWIDGTDVPLVAAQGYDLLAALTLAGERAVVRLPGVLEPAGETVLTPVLESEQPTAAWRRADLAATLPPGATLELSWLATSDQGSVAAARAIAKDVAATTAARIATLDNLLLFEPRGSVTYLGEDRGPNEGPALFDMPLGEVTGTALWLRIELHRNRASERPDIAGLTVRHGGENLMERLPAVFRTPDGDRDGTLQRLVAVLEATFLGFDDSISGLAQLLDPARCPDEHLPELARLLGLPFDTALDSAQQRRLVLAAPDILAGRGTRRAIRALLAAIFGDRPFRVEDRSGRTIPAMLGGKGLAGSALPALLGGPSRRIPRLNARLVLGGTALCKVSPCDNLGIAPVPALLVAIPASPGEQRRLGGAVEQMIQALIPAGIRLVLRWTGLDQAFAGDVLAVASRPRAASLGAHPPLGRAVLGGDRERSRLGSPRLTRKLDQDTQERTEP